MQRVALCFVQCGHSLLIAIDICTMQDVAQKPFATITYTEAVDLLKKSKAKFEFPVEWGADLQSEHERFLTEKEFQGTPLMVTDYPKAIKVIYCPIFTSSSKADDCCFTALQSWVVLSGCICAVTTIQGFAISYPSRFY